MRTRVELRTLLLSDYAWTVYTAIAITAAWALALALGGSSTLPTNWFYLPILAAGLRFGPYRVAVVALVCAVVAGPLLPASTSLGTEQPLTYWLARGASFLVIGEVTWFMRRLIAKHQQRSDVLAEQHERRDRREAATYRLLAQTVEATDEVRDRIASQLHDGPIQALTMINFTLERARLKADSRHPKESLPLLDSAADAITREIQALRELMRDLRPPALDHTTFSETVRDFVATLEERSGVKWHVEVATTGDNVPPAIATGLYRIAQEALTNVLKHAQATQVFIDIANSADGITMSIRDNGVGCELDRIDDHLQGTHMGLDSMAQRARMLGGHLLLRSSPGAGMALSVNVPA